MYSDVDYKFKFNVENLKQCHSCTDYDQGFLSHPYGGLGWDKSKVLTPTFEGMHPTPHFWGSWGGGHVYGGGGLFDVGGGQIIPIIFGDHPKSMRVF